MHDQVAGRLVIAGAGLEEARVRREVTRLDLRGRVHFAGWVRGADKELLLSGARAAGRCARTRSTAGSPPTAWTSPS